MPLCTLSESDSQSRQRRGHEHVRRQRRRYMIRRALLKGVRMAGNRLVVSERYSVNAVMQHFTQRITAMTLTERLQGPGRLFSIVYQDHRRLVLSRWTHRFWLYMLLLALGLLPGIVYEIFARNKQRTTTIDIARAEGGSVLVEITGNDKQALKTLRKFSEREFGAVPLEVGG